MLRAMYGGSRLMPLGFTTTCCSTRGQTPPISTLENTNSYLSYQYWTALSSTTAASNMDSCSVASEVILRPGPDNRMPSNRYWTTTTEMTQIAMMTKHQPNTSWIIGRVNT